MRRLTIPSAVGLVLLCGSGLMAATAETIPFLTLMQPANETPAITDTSLGNAIIWLHVVRDNNGNITSGSVDFDIACKFSGAVTVTGLHIHNGAAGAAGPIVIPTDVNATTNSIVVGQKLSDRLHSRPTSGEISQPSGIPKACAA